MARPERNTVDYFPFYCDEGNKMFYLEETYGNDGFATFVKILRELARTEYHYLNLSKNTTIMFLSAKCKVSKEVLEMIINDLVELGKFNRLLWEENKVIWCQDFIDGIQDAYKKRNNECITFEGLLTLLESLGVRKPSKSKSEVSVKPQIKEKKRKEENIEGFFDVSDSSLNTPKTTSIAPPSIYDDYDFFDDQFAELWIDFVKMRKAKKQPLTDRAVKLNLNEIKKLSGGDRELAYKICEQTVKSGWAGFFPLNEKIKKISTEGLSRAELADRRRNG